MLAHSYYVPYNVLQWNIFGVLHQLTSIVVHYCLFFIRQLTVIP